MTRQALAVAGAATALAVAALTACSGASPPPATAGNPFTGGPSASGQPAAGQSAGGSSAGGSSAGGSSAGGGSATGGPSAAGLPAGTPAAARSACKQQYNVWQQGPGQGLVATLTAFGQSATATDLTDALTKAKPALARASQNPMPQCADPRGYWMVLVMHVNAASAASSNSSVKSALKGVPAIAHALLAELQQTAAVT